VSVSSSIEESVNGDYCSYMVILILFFGELAIMKYGNGELAIVFWRIGDQARSGSDHKQDDQISTG